MRLTARGPAQVGHVKIGRSFVEVLYYRSGSAFLLGLIFGSAFWETVKKDPFFHATGNFLSFYFTMKSDTLSTSSVTIRQQTILEAAHLFAHIGYYEAYFEDIWCATLPANTLTLDSTDAYGLALSAFKCSADSSTRQLGDSGLELDEFLAVFGRFWPEESLSGTSAVLNAWVDRERIYPIIAEKAAGVLNEWGQHLSRLIASRSCSKTTASALASHFIEELAGGYSLATSYRNRSHFQRALDRVRKAMFRECR